MALTANKTTQDRLWFRRTLFQGGRQFDHLIIVLSDQVPVDGLGHKQRIEIFIGSL